MGVLILPKATTTDRLTITPAAGELVYDTDTEEVFKGDGSTVGGVPMAEKGLVFTAGENISAFRAVFIENDGKAYVLGSSDTTNAPAFTGITNSAVSVDDTAAIVTAGALTNSGWSFTPNLPVFVGSSGQITQTPPTAGFSLRLGFATSSTSILFNVADLTILS